MDEDKGVLLPEEEESTEQPEIVTLPTAESEENPGKKPKKRILFIIIAALAVLVIAAVILIGVFSGDTGSAQSEQLNARDLEEFFTFETHESNVFSAFGKGSIVASVADVTVYDKKGNVSYESQISCSSPAITAAQQSAAVYDAGGMSVYAFTDKKQLYDYFPQEQIVHADINDKGWMCVTTLDKDYKAAVTVLDDEGSEVYRFYSAGSYVLGASIAPGCKQMAVFSAHQEEEVFNCKVTLFDLKKEDPQAEFTLEDDVILKADWCANDTIVCIAQSGISFLDAKAKLRGTYEFGDYVLHNCAMTNDGYVAVSLVKENSRLYGTVATVDYSGRELGSDQISGTVQSLGASDSGVAVLLDNSMLVYNRNMKLKTLMSSTDGARSVIATDSNAMLLISHSAAKIFNP
ncbi:MAG: hypothetical protein IKM51_05905 [Oscillospiraceae bacterium]|nr:hypothetical protein [Oscillospiraceae bacterium]